MSQDLLDEIEAINSIYEDGTLVYLESSTSTSLLSSSSTPCSSSSQSLNSSTTKTTALLLTLPTGTTLALHFPPSYPSTSPPVAAGVHASGAGQKRGSAAKDLEDFRRAVGRVWVGGGGGVCVFDALEEFSRLRSEEEEGGNDEGEEGGEGEGAVEGEEGRDRDAGEEGGEEGMKGVRSGAGDKDTGRDAKILSSPPPPWATTEPVTEQKSVFVGRAAGVTSPAQAADYIRHLLLTDRKVRDATHNISAWRIRGSGTEHKTTSAAPTAGSTQDYDDDGETAAGSRLLRLLQLMDVWDVVVVVSRWYGGVKLGPRRFAVINSVGRDAVVLAGLGPPSAAAAAAAADGKKDKGGGGKKRR